MGNRTSNNPEEPPFDEKMKRTREDILRLREQKLQQGISEQSESTKTEHPKKPEEEEPQTYQEVIAKSKESKKEEVKYIEKPIEIKQALKEVKYLENPKENPREMKETAGEMTKNDGKNPIKAIDSNQTKQKPVLKPEELDSRFIEETFMRDGPKITSVLEGDFPAGKLLNLYMIDDILDTLLRSSIPDIFEVHMDKLSYLYRSWVRSENSHLRENPRINNELRVMVQKKICSYIFSLVLTPLVYEIEDNAEETGNIVDVKDNLKGKFTAICLEELNEEFLECFFEYLLKEANDDDLYELFESINKRILLCFQGSNLEKTKAMMNNLSFLSYLLKKPRLSQIFTEKSKTFINKNKVRFGLELEKFTIFGSFLSKLGFLPSIENKYYETYFKGAEKMMKQVVEKNMSNVREKINEPIGLLFKMMESLIRNGMKRQVLDWFFFAIEKNKDKVKMYNPNSMLNSSDDFLINLLRISLLFCLPFIETEDKMLQKLDKINPFFVNFEQNGPFQGYESFNPQVFGLKSGEVAKDVNFITEIYYVTILLIHINQKLYKNYMEFLRKLNNLQKTNPNSPEFFAMFSQKLAIDTFLLDPVLIENIIRIFGFTSLLILSFFEIKYDPINECFASNEGLLESTCNEKLARMPAFLAEDMFEYLILIFQLCPELLMKKIRYFGFCCDFILIAMSSKNVLLNPHVRAQFVMFLSILVPEKERESRGIHNQFKGILTERPVFNEFLVEGLIMIFIDVEKTGSNNQFYEKFSYRRGACRLISFILAENATGKFDYKIKFKQFLEKKSEIFVQFMFRLLNDLIYLLDESLNRIKEIKVYEENEENITNPQEKLEKKRIYEENKRIVSIFFFSLNSYYENIDIFSFLAPYTMVKEEILEKLVNNLNYTIEALNGKNSLSLKTKNMKKLNFDPKLILKCIIHLYLNLGKYEVFLNTIVRDERSFNEKTFEKTLKILIRENLLFQEEIDQFTQILSKLSKMKIEEKEQEEALGDVPEEFLDPLLMDLMSDPVLLPSSNNIVDRMTIIKHLLSDPTDPFNRQPLRKEDLIPQEDLRKKIEEWKKKKLNKKGESREEETKKGY